MTEELEKVKMEMEDRGSSMTDGGKSCLLGQSFFMFRFTDPPDPIFWKLKKKKKRFFSILFFYFPLTHASTVLEFAFCLF